MFILHFRDVKAQKAQPAFSDSVFKSNVFKKLKFGWSLHFSFYFRSFLFSVINRLRTFFHQNIAFIENIKRKFEGTAGGPTWDLMDSDHFFSRAEH